MSPANSVFLGIKGSVLALDRATGRRLWSTKLKGDEFVNLLVDGNLVFAATRGEVFCLDAASGNLLWHDPLKGFGWGLAAMATAHTSAPTSTAAELLHQQAAAAASSASTTTAT
jgi:outer membrane protein assembly factor BamB